MAPYKVLKDLHPNKEYAELLRSVASRVDTLEEPISDEMIEQIKILSEKVINQGREEKEKAEKIKQNVLKTAMDGAIKRHEKQNKMSTIQKMVKRKNKKHKRIDNAALLAARGIRKREKEKENNNI